MTSPISKPRFIRPSLRRPWGTVLALLPFAIFFTPPYAAHLPDEEVTIHNEIIWSEHTDSPLFVPQKRLPPPTGPELEALIGTRGYASLLGSISHSKHRIENAEPRHCSGSLFSPRAENSKPYLDAFIDVVLRTNATDPTPGWVVIFGTIIDATLGWDATYGAVATRSLVSLETTLFDETDQLAGIGHVTFYDYYGKLAYGGTELCSSKVNISEPQVGDKIILVGWMGDPTGNRVHRRFHFLVQDGEVLPEPYINPHNRTTVTLDDVRNGIQARITSQSDEKVHQ